MQKKSSIYICLRAGRSKIDQIVTIKIYSEVRLTHKNRSILKKGDITAARLIVIALIL